MFTNLALQRQETVSRRRQIDVSDFVEISAEESSGRDQSAQETVGEEPEAVGPYREKAAFLTDLDGG